MVTWDDDASAGGWIADRLGQFGPRVEGTVPRGYAAYACVPHPGDDVDETPDVAEDASAGSMVAQAEALAAALAPSTGDQPIHLALWTGHAFLYDAGTDPRTTSGIGVFVAWDEDEPRPSEEEIARARAEAWDSLAQTLVERPTAPMLLLPNREYHLWTGTLSDVGVFREHGQPPNLWWPHDRSWFVGTEIDAAATYVGGSEELVDALCADRTAARALGAYRVTPSDLMVFDD
ncbi:hypothetical protein IF650_07680 [Cellulosimicrobium terreum]|nr:hypothetical protein [Cellulosimicrobium terreum]